MKTAITLFIIILLFATVTFVAGTKADQQYCRNLQVQAGDGYQGYYITANDNEMCNQLDLPVNALVKE